MAQVNLFGQSGSSSGIKSKQIMNCTINAALQNITINEVDINNTLIFISSNLGYDITLPQYAYLTSSTNLACYNAIGTGSTMMIIILEFNAGLIKGIQRLSGSANSNITINAVDINKSIILPTSIHDTNSTNGNQLPYATFTDSTTVNVAAKSYGTNCVEVIEFN